MRIIGVLNVTPDSFHDGGAHATVEAAVARAGVMIEQGADIIEIGGESTGPKSKDVSAEEELARVLPVIKALRAAHPSVPLSVDTYKAAVASAALTEGVAFINDVTAGRGDAALFSVVAPSKAKLILMYSKDPTARTTVDHRQYPDVIKAVMDFLRDRKAQAIKAGIAEERIILDPGLGHFVSSDPQYSFQILARLPEFLALGSPLLLSPSRKSFLAGPENLPTTERLPGTVAASAIAVLNGAEYIRTHDPLEVKRGCAVAEEIRKRMS